MKYSDPIPPVNPFFVGLRNAALPCTLLWAFIALVVYGIVKAL